MLETEITLGETTYRVRPTLRAVRRLEAIAPPLALARDLLAGQIGLTGMSNILQAMLRDEKDCPKLDEIQEALFEQGLTDLVGPVSEYLGRCWMGNKRATEEAEKRAAEVAAGAAGDPPQTAH